MREDGEPTTFPLSVWIDEDGYARRVRLRDGEEAMTLEYFAFGERVDVVEPRDAEVMDDGEWIEFFAKSYTESACDAGQPSEPAQADEGESRVVLCIVESEVHVSDDDE